MLGWPQLENGEPQELFGCESICLFCFLTVTGTRNKLVRHLKSCETFQTLAVRKKFQIKDSLFINRKIPRTGYVPSTPTDPVAYRQDSTLMIHVDSTPEEKYGPPIASDDPRHLRYKTSLNNNALFRSAKVQNLPFAAAVKTRFGIPTELQHVEGVASTRPHSKPTPGLPEFPAKLRSVQTSIVDALASGTARQSSKQGTYERSIQPMKPSSTPPQSRILRDRQKVVTRASSALAPGAPSTQHGVPPGLSEVQQYESLKNDKDRAVLEDERVDLKAAPSITASSPTSPSIARSSDLIPIEKEDVHNEGSVSARHQGLRVSTDDTAAGRLFSGEGSSHQTAIVTGPDTVDPSSCIVNAIAVNRTTGASSTTTRIDPPKAEHVDCRIEEGDQVQGKSIPHREQTPGPFQHRADDGSCSESGSDEVNRLEKQDADARVADLFIDIMSIVDGTEVEESQILDPCPPRAASADIERPTSVSAELFLQSGISSLPHAHQYSRVITNATNTVCPSNTFLAVNGEHAKPPPSSPRVPSQSRNDTVPTAQTKLPTPSTIPSKNRFLPLTSGPSNLELDFGFEQKVAAVLRSQVWQDSEWMRNVEDSLFTRLANRLKEDSGTGQMHVGTFSGTLQKRKYADTLSGESNQPDNSAPEVSHEPEKRIRLLDSAKGDGFLQGTHRESEAKDKLIESLQNENESYRAQVALLSERLKQLEGTGILQKVPLHEAATSGSDDSAPKL